MHRRKKSRWRKRCREEKPKHHRPPKKPRLLLEPDCSSLPSGIIELNDPIEEESNLKLKTISKDEPPSGHWQKQEEEEAPSDRPFSSQSCKEYEEEAEKDLLHLSLEDEDDVEGVFVGGGGRPLSADALESPQERFVPRRRNSRIMIGEDVSQCHSSAECEDEIASCEFAYQEVEDLFRPVSRTSSTVALVSEQASYRCFISMTDVFLSSPLSSLLCAACGARHSGRRDRVTVDLRGRTLTLTCGECNWWTARRISLSGEGGGMRKCQGVVPFGERNGGPTSSSKACVEAPTAKSPTTSPFTTTTSTSSSFIPNTAIAQECQLDLTRPTNL